MKTVIRAAIMVGIIMFGIGFLSGSLIILNQFQKEAIEQGFAQYSPTTRSFEWKKGVDYE